jgi:HSP20 family protein
MTNDIEPKAKPAPAAADIFSAMRAELDQMFSRFRHGLNVPKAFETAAVVPTLDVKDLGHEVVIEAELPGVDEKDITLSIKDGVVTIAGEKRHNSEEKDENHYVLERSFGRFARSVRLPEGVDEDAVKAHFDNGVLTVTAAKRAGSAKPERKIEIQTR